VPSGSARDVQRTAGRNGIDEGPDDRLLETDQRIDRFIISRRPSRVAAGDVLFVQLELDIARIPVERGGKFTQLAHSCRERFVATEPISNYCDAVQAERIMCESNFSH
jgi:hypothetical protein